MGTAMIKCFPEYAELDKADRLCLIRVLSYYHKPHEIPLDGTLRQRSLIKYLSESDQAITSAERKSTLVETGDGYDLEKDLADTLMEVLNDLNINKSLSSSNADGWNMAALEYVPVLEENIRQKLKQFASEKMKSLLMLKVPFSNEGAHPATEKIVEALEKMGALITEHNDIVSESKMFNIRNGSVSFNGVLFLDKKMIEELNPGIIDKWGSSKFRMKVLSAYEHPSQ